MKPTTPRLRHAALERRIPRSRSRRPVGRRLPAAAYPQKSGRNPSQGPIIHRPHPHPKHTGLWEFRAPSRPPGGGRFSARPPPGPERAAARSARGRRPVKYGTVRVTTLVASKKFGVAGRGPNLSALLKGPARRPGTGPPGGVLAFLERGFVRIPPPAVLPRGQRQGEGEDPTRTHCTNAGGQQDGRGGHRRGRRP